MNYYVFNTANFTDTEKEPTWDFIERFADLRKAEAFTQAKNDEGGRVFRLVPAATEEDARAHIEMPNQPF